MPTRDSTRQLLVDAAMRRFATQGFDQTTVDEIAADAGVSRMTFFRAFATKEQVVFPDHEAMIAGLTSRLAAAAPDDWAVVLPDAARRVLAHYVDEGVVARRRYRLTSTVDALRQFELGMVARYQRAFRAYLSQVGRPAGEDAGLWAELLAAATVTAHNVVLRRTLRGETDDPFGALDHAMREVIARFQAAP